MFLQAEDLGIDAFRDLTLAATYKSIQKSSSTQSCGNTLKTVLLEECITGVKMVLGPWS